MLIVVDPLRLDNIVFIDQLRVTLSPIIAYITIDFRVQSLINEDNTTTLNVFAYS